MALDLSKLKRIGPQAGTGGTTWSYQSGADALATVDSAGYFNGAADRLKLGDIIFVVPTTLPAGIMTVNANSRDLAANPPVSGVVDTTDAVSLTTTDTD